MGLRVKMLLRTRDKIKMDWLHRAGTPLFWCAEGLQLGTGGQDLPEREGRGQERGALHLVHGISEGYQRRIRTSEFAVIQVHVSISILEMLTNNALVLESALYTMNTTTIRVFNTCSKTPQLDRPAYSEGRRPGNQSEWARHWH